VHLHDARFRRYRALWRIFRAFPWRHRVFLWIFRALLRTYRSLLRIRESRVRIHRALLRRYRECVWIFTTALLRTMCSCVYACRDVYIYIHIYHYNVYGCIHDNMHFCHTIVTYIDIYIISQTVHRISL